MTLRSRPYKQQPTVRLLLIDLDPRNMDMTKDRIAGDATRFADVSVEARA